LTCQFFKDGNHVPQENGVIRERVDFSKIKNSIPIPNLIEVQKKSYERFLQMDLLPPSATTRVWRAFLRASSDLRFSGLEPA